MPIRRVMAAGSATDVPPNFITTPTTDLRCRVGQVGPVGRAISYKAFPVDQFGIQNCRSGSPANRVMSECNELVVEHRATPQPANGHRHPAVAARVERRLRPIRFG